MNHRERFYAVADGLRPDRAPVCMWHHYFDALSHGRANVDAQEEFVRETEVDVVKISVDGYMEYPFSAPVRTASDLGRIRPLPANAPYFTEQVERAQWMMERVGAEHPTLYVIFSPLSTLNHTLSDEAVAAFLREDRAAVVEGMKVVLEDTLTLMRGIMERGGCDGMLLPLQCAEEGRFSPEEYRALIHPFDAAVYAAAGEYSPYSVCHMCGWSGVKNQLECWDGLDARVRVVNWATAVEGISLAEGKKRFAGRPVMGGFDNRVEGLLYSAGEAAVKAYAKEQLASVDGQAILAADCSLPADIAPERIRWVVEAAREFEEERAR